MMIRIRFGIVLRISEIITLLNAVITVTDKPITIAGSSCTVTASAEQIPKTCTKIGLFKFNGPENILRFSFENKLPITCRYFVKRLCRSPSIL